ncbi:unnamed protein product [Cylindrotheca closterium]|uniref:Exportin-1/Importin-beta-like domain-containing protein n=1 Tax=Cylindrotheca closterium TaxID=2856 RepID=A0AAD2CDJ7_9STRA|nr:unnamed protein product [Cylindrotheca closterium]
MEDQVAQAALAMVNPTTDSATRRQASQFLEEWTQRHDAWDVYAKWLGSFRSMQEKTSDQIAMQMLCLTMLQTKLRKEIPRNDPSKWHPSIQIVRQELWEYARQQQFSTDASLSSLLTPCCICNAAVIVRCGILSDFMSHVGNTNSDLPPDAMFRLLACIPYEMEACQDLTTPQVTQELVPFLEVVLDIIRRGLEDTSTSNIQLPACMALKEWSNISHVSLSQLNTPTCGGQRAVLPALMSLLSSSTSYNDERLLQAASQALTAAVMVVSDHCTPTREAAAASMWNAISSGFIVGPMQLASQNEWHDACHALATLICTFVTEQVDDLISQPAEVGLEFLLQIQAHPHTPVALIPLDCWLTVQETPLEDRHENWRKPLLRKVVATLLTRMAYPTNFVNWEEELDLDSQEFNELRRMVTDVLVSGYYLLRGELIQTLTNHVRTATHWTASEAALVCLSQIARDVCGRCKSNAAAGTSIARDRDLTCQELLQLLDQLVSVDAKQQHSVLLASILNFCGSYCPAWNSMNCPPQAILRLLQFLQSSFSILPLESAKATRAVFVSCLSKSMPSLDDLQGSNNQSSSIMPLVLKSVRDSMEAALATSSEEAMTMVAEGATRLVTKTKDAVMARQGLVNDLIHPIVQRGQLAMNAFPESGDSEDWLSPNVQLALESLVRIMSVIHVIVRFCDAPYVPAVSEWLLMEIGPFLEAVQGRTTNLGAQQLVIPKWITIHMQLLRNSASQESMVLAMFSNTIPLIVQALEGTKDPSTLRYISAAVEMFGGKSDEVDHSFKELLAHVTNIVANHAQSTECAELLQSFFECMQRFILYGPRALCYNPQFGTILTLAVESIRALNGAKESTRASLMFLSQLFGFNLLRVSPQVQQVLQEAWQMVLKDMLKHHGSSLVQSCVVGLAGGPQMLWPAYADCLFQIVQSILNNPRGENGSADFTDEMLQQWLLSSMTSVISSKDTNMTTDMCSQVVSILFTLARKGTKGRPKAKMLLSDFAKILKGEMAPDALVSYALQ